MWLYVAIWEKYAKTCQNMPKRAKTCKQTSHPQKALIRAKYYKVLQTITKKTPMRYSTDPRKQRKQQKYIAIFLAIFAALFAISFLLCKFCGLFCG